VFRPTRLNRVSDKNNVIVDIEHENHIRHLMREVVPERCPRHLNFLKRFDSYLLSINSSPATRYKHLQSLSLFFNFLESKDLSYDKVDMNIILEYISYKRSQGVSDIKSLLKPIKKLLKYMISVEGRKDLLDVYSNIKLQERKREEKLEVLSREEFYKLLENIDVFEYKVAVAILYEASLRISELRNLRYSDVKATEYGFDIVIHRSKSVPRTIPIIEFSALLASWLSQHPLKKTDSFIFPSKFRKDKPIARNTLNNYIKRVAERTGLEKRIYVHLFRHSRATQLYGKLREKEMMYIFGWRTRKMIDRYSHLKPEEIKRSLLSIYGIIEKKDEKTKIIKCPRCGLGNHENSLYCNRCGYPLKEELRIKTVKSQAELLTVIKSLREEFEELKKDIESIKSRRGTKGSRGKRGSLSI